MRGERGFRSEALETRPCSDYEQGMKRLLIASAIALSIAAAAYSLFVAIYAALTAEGYDPSIFWTSIGVIFVIAAGALWLASRFYRRHFRNLHRSAARDVGPRARRADTRAMAETAH